jgi:hypothetical protein
MRPWIKGMVIARGDKELWVNVSLPPQGASPLSA